MLQLKESVRDGAVYTAGCLLWEMVHTGRELAEPEIDQVPYKPRSLVYFRQQEYQLFIFKFEYFSYLKKKMDGL